MSEFGGYSRLCDQHVWNPQGSFGYRMYESKAALTEAYASLLRGQVLPLISQGLSATVYTQLSDVELEVNSILTYDRCEIKMDEQVIKALNEALRKI
ncbi:MAG: hypothetical protein MZW92_59425 [Comamonadaceae bacterium]|nr:hypothetical protein [Comamonadaceae bacterium]